MKARVNLSYAQHGKDLIRVGHDELLRWYTSLDGKMWTSVDHHTLGNLAIEFWPEIHRKFFGGNKRGSSGQGADVIYAIN